MLKHTPFHPRLVELNETMLWENWAGYASPTQFQFATTVEYFAIRNAAGLFDTSPLFKYHFKGPEATQFLASVLTRDIRTYKIGESQYTIWCDERGFVVEDGVILHVAKDEYWLTAAEPNLKYFSDLNGRLKKRYDVKITDISEEYGILALQGPQALNILKQLNEDVTKLNYFDVIQTKINKKPIILSRTGFSGDLGFELWIKSEDCLAIWDALMEVGHGYNMTPVGSTVISMARIDGGLLLIDVDFASSRYAWVDAQRETPFELGLGWMIKNLSKDDRPFVGRKAIETEKKNSSSRWKTVGLQLDPFVYEEIHNQRGIIAPKADFFYQDTFYIYDKDYNVDNSANYAGYVTSLMFSPLLKKHIAIAKVHPEHAKRGSQLFIELEVLRQSHYFPANVVRMPFYNPHRKTAKANTE